MFPHLSTHFLKYFTLFVADTPSLLDEVYKIRYQVYCEELNYEPVEKFPDGKERDSYDQRSIHCLLKHKPSGRYAGCVRVVLADLQNLQAPFPFEKVCSHHFDFQQKPRSRFLEISRLAVPSEFRKRKGESETPAGLIFFDEKNPDRQNKRRFPLIALSLYLACLSIAQKLGCDAFSLMEARLARHLRLCGIPSSLVGDFINFRGKRGPFLLIRQEVLDKVGFETYELYEKIHTQLNLSALELKNR